MMITLTRILLVVQLPQVPINKRERTNFQTDLSINLLITSSIQLTHRMYSIPTLLVTPTPTILHTPPSPPQPPPHQSPAPPEDVQRRPRRLQEAPLHHQPARQPEEEDQDHQRPLQVVTAEHHLHHQEDRVLFQSRQKKSLKNGIHLNLFQNRHLLNISRRTCCTKLKIIEYSRFQASFSLF